MLLIKLGDGVSTSVFVAMMLLALLHTDDGVSGSCITSACSTWLSDHYHDFATCLVLWAESLRSSLF